MENPEHSLERFRSAAERLKLVHRITKQGIANTLFVSRGLKPTTEFEMLFSENTPGDSRKEFEEDIADLEKIFEDLALTFHENRGRDYDTDMESVEFFIAQDETMKGELIKATNLPISKERDRIIGKIYGIPETAIDAFVKGRGYVIGREDMPEAMRDSKEVRLASFLFSKEHWQEELEIIRERILNVEAIVPGYFDNL